MFYVEDPDHFKQVKTKISKGPKDHFRVEADRKVGIESFPLRRLLEEQAKSAPSQSALDVLKASVEQLHRHLNSPVLSTEALAKETIGLAEMVQDDARVGEAIAACEAADHRALQRLIPLLTSERFQNLVASIKTTLENGGKIYFSGCSRHLEFRVK